MNDELMKRTNPFERKKDPIEEEEPVVEPVEEKIEEDTEYEEVVQPKKVNKPTYTQPKQVKQVKTSRYVEEESIYREKYTSTMDISLRRTIKIVCATRGIMFAQFIEDACREKLQREGVK